MNNVANKNATLEILVSTKDQNSDTFIHKMFKTCPNFKHQVLVINTIYTLFKKGADKICSFFISFNLLFFVYY